MDTSTGERNPSAGRVIVSSHAPTVSATVLTDRFDRALLYATHVHGGQVRKGTSTPYVAHLLAVAATVLEYGGDEDLAIAALLHDSVEDQGGKARLEDVRNRFGGLSRPVPTAWLIRRKASARRTGKSGRKPIWRICERHTTTSCAFPLRIRFTTRVRSYVTCENRMSAKPSGRDSASPRNGHSGTIAAWRTGSVKGCPVSCPTSCEKSWTFWKLIGLVDDITGSIGLMWPRREERSG
jgi:hypothetical protein